MGEKQRKEMKQSKINRIQELHKKVIHVSNHIDGYTDIEYLKEDKEIKRLNSSTLNLVCPTCFPLLNRPKYSSRTVEIYSIDYPKIRKIVNAWNE